jgi:hypothetical protein
MNEAAGALDPLVVVMRYHQEMKHHFHTMRARPAAWTGIGWPDNERGGSNIRGTIQGISRLWLLIA